MTPNPEVFEKLGVFFLGRRYNLETRELAPDLVLYDSKDLTTHGLCVGMTGSGKTGLCLALLEEAAIDGIPAIAVDPKGDLGNLLLTFPDLLPENFKPWLEASEATRQGISLDELAAKRAQQWREGLASWGQDSTRISKFKDKVDITIYTPGSNTGIPLTVLKGFDAPAAAVMEDRDLFRERITAATSALLSLLGVDGDPLNSREHILLGSIFQHAWSAGKNLSLGDIIGQMQTPPFRQVGVLDVDSFMPPADRGKLAMQLNNLLASPAFSSWLEGEPLNIQNLLYTPEGKPRLSILSIAHLSDRERMFFVTVLLGELLAWTRTQSGTSSLRAIFYMDEVAGYFPPVANPPSKPPMLTLLKQARAFGLGITLATQNPVDLDYKGLANIGTWWLGRLQTERDKQRVLEGLEGAATHGGQAFDRQKMEQTLASLGNRVFLMNNVHEDAPVVFQTRWDLSFLAGPLGRTQISSLMEKKKKALASDSSTSADTEPAPASGAVDARKDTARGPAKSSKVAHVQASRPIAPTGVTQSFARFPGERAPLEQLVYRPAVLAQGQVHYVKASADLDTWSDVRIWVRSEGLEAASPWEFSSSAPELVIDDDPLEGVEFDEAPASLRSAANFKNWTKTLKDHLYRHHALNLYYSPLLDSYAAAGSSEGEARVYFGHSAREHRDTELAKLRAKYAKLEDGLIKRLQGAKERLDREQAEYDGAKWSSVLDVGASVLGGLFGNKRSRISTTRVSTAARGVGRATQARGDVQAAQAALEEIKNEILDLNDQAKREAEEMALAYDPEQLKLESVAITPRKADIKVEPLTLVWVLTPRD